MKRFILLSLLLLPTLCFAQEVQVEPPSNTDFTVIKSLISMLFADQFTSVFVQAAFVTLVSGYFNKMLPNAKGYIYQIISWLIAIATAFIAYLAGIGIYAEFDWVYTLINGIAAGLIANGYYEIPAVKKIVDKIGGKTDIKHESTQVYK